MEIVSFSNVLEKQWDNFVSKHPYAWLYHTHTYIQWSESLYRSADFEPSFGFAVLQGGEVLGICPLILGEDYVLKPILFGLVKHPVKIRTLTTEFAFPLVAMHINPKRQRKVWKLITSQLNILINENKIDRIATRLIHPGRYATFYDDMANHFYKFGFNHLYSSQPRRCIVINLEDDLDQILYNMDQDCRAAIKQAERNQVAISEESTLNDDGSPSHSLKSFHAIHTESWKRTGLSPYPLSYFVNIVTSLGKNRCRLFLAQQNNTDIAAALVHAYKDAALYYNGCSTSTGYQLRANNLMQWKIIEQLKNDGYRYYEVGVFNTSIGSNEKEYSVGQFKAQFSKQSHPTIELVKDITKTAALERYLINSGQ